VAADPDSTAALPGSTGLVVLDTAITPELAAEGTARDVVRVVQQARRDAGLDVADRIALTLDGPEAVLDAARAHEAFVAGEVLAVSVTYGSVPEPVLRGTVASPDGGSAEVAVLVARA
jgi:isoleucyl-tRNA synthetase